MIGHAVQLEATKASDTEFYMFVHSLIEEQLRGNENAASAEQRGKQRQSFNFLQLIAPYDGRRMPNQAEFHQVLCQDLSAGGFSYFTTDRPDYDGLIVALGAVPFNFFTAQILHRSHSYSGKLPGFRIGCQFTGRIFSSGDTNNEAAS
ncbi:MAG: hypothetical protein SGJ20_11140 [Planctomycetota bacterium]|nr:hypothetical protein [Planctomycetota bacterium]